MSVTRSGQRAQRSGSNARRIELVRLLESVDVARPAELAMQLDVSVETIRRDLIKLEADGDVQRVHGGVARARLSANSEPVRRERAAIQLQAKTEIGRLTAGLIGESDTVIFDVGTTVEACARSLPSAFHGKIITNNISVVQNFYDRDGAGPEVHLLGGRVRLEEGSCSGPDTGLMLRQFHADKAILGSGGVHPDAGLTDYDVDELLVRLQMIEAAREIYVVADATKLGHVALRRVCGWDVVDAIITDSQADPASVASLQRAGVEVLQSPELDSEWVRA